MSPAPRSSMDTKPISPVLALLLESIEREATARMERAADAAQREAGLPEGAALDVGNRVWILPDPPEPDEPAGE